MKRLMEAPRMVLATGGGAILNPDTLALLKRRATTVWLKADLSVVAARVQRRDTRPLLRGRDPHQALSELAEVRYPIYACSDVTVEVGRGTHAESVDAIVTALDAFFASQAVSAAVQA